MSKVITQLLWFCIDTVCDWLKVLAPLSPPIRSKTKTNRDCLYAFPALGAGYMYLLRALIGSLASLQLLRLVRVITLVLVLQHLIENRSIHWIVIYPVDSAVHL